MIQVSVSSFRKIKDNEDSYTVFTVDVWVYGVHHVVEKRYSEFEELHKMLKKVIKTPEFPPKKVLKWNPKVLEQRRVGLDAYFKSLIEQGNVPHAVLLFLEADGIKNNMEFMQEEDEPKPSHQPVIMIDSSFLQEKNQGGLPNIVSEGVLLGLYTPAPAEFSR